MKKLTFLFAALMALTTWTFSGAVLAGSHEQPAAETPADGETKPAEGGDAKKKEEEPDC